MQLFLFEVKHQLKHIFFVSVINCAVEKCINKYTLYCWIDWLLDLS